MSIYQYYIVQADYAEIKFEETIDTSTLVNANFTVNQSGATPSGLVDPFKPINLLRDFSSISRTLRLWWNLTLSSNTDYTINIANLKNTINIVLPSDTIFFSTETVVDVDEIVPPTREPIDVEDYSVKAIQTLFPNSISVSNSTMLVVTSIKPSIEDAAYMDPSFNEGRIEITFSAPLAANFISPEFFRVQRKKLGKGISRWEVVDTIVTSDGNFVMIYMPSTDDVPVYGEPAYIYYEEGYKYRLRISAEVGPATL